tara:strand:- start:1507 stop:2082 length:576 start_codon:yes stop_codon:yes gene_type:complete
MKKFFLIILFLIVPLSSNSESVKPILVGDKQSKVKIVVYESLTCSHCAEFHKKIYPGIKSEFIDKNKVLIEFRSFPLDLAALNASKLAHCKNDGSSKILHKLYEKQKNWAKGSSIEEINSNLKKTLKEENININFDKCLMDKNLENFILKERIEGVKKFNIDSTPTIIINDEKFEKSLTFKNLKKVIENLL